MAGRAELSARAVAPSAGIRPEISAAHRLHALVLLQSGRMKDRMTGIDKSFRHLSPEGFKTIGYREWGRADHLHVVLCVHGLSRNRLDFTALGERLGDRCRVLSIDLPGRGLSDWMTDPARYAVPFYAEVCATLIAVSGASQVDWVGTSLGGLTGMSVATQPGAPVRRLVLNDIGPHVPAEGRRQNQQGFGSDPYFPDFQAAVDWFRSMRTPVVGEMPDRVWEAMARVSLRRAEEGGYRLHYDPALAQAPTQKNIETTDMWPAWYGIRCPVLTVWGRDSQLLLEADVEKMKTSGPKSRVHEVPGVGHAPPVMGTTLEAIADFLLVD